MYARILAAVNEFTNSEIAARYALALAKACRAKLLLVFVAEAPVTPSAFRRAESALERLFIEAERQGIEVESITEEGDPVRKIRETVREQDVDLVVIATRREDIERRFFIRTRARDLMTRLPCSVAMARVVHMGKGHPRDILVPLKGRLSYIDERAYFIGKLAEGLDSRLTLFHLPRPLTTLFRGEAPLSVAEREQRPSRDIECFIEHLKKYGVVHERRTGSGRIARSITTEAAFKKNDLIIMGASERSLLRSMVSGSPVEQVLREAPCNLIIFKPRLRPRQKERRGNRPPCP
ncbi:MAG: universal stress protein [Nitrospirota bacterium]